MKLLGWLNHCLAAQNQWAKRVSPAEQPSAAWRPTHRHRSGGYYRLLTLGIYEADRSSVAIYDDATGTVWVRPAAEFNDGRFTPVLNGPTQPKVAGPRNAA
jgi:hypothetical protein